MNINTIACATATLSTSPPHFPATPRPSSRPRQIINLTLHPNKTVHVHVQPHPPPARILIPTSSLRHIHARHRTPHSEPPAVCIYIRTYAHLHALGIEIRTRSTIRGRYASPDADPICWEQMRVRPSLPFFQGFYAVSVRLVRNGKLWRARALSQHNEAPWSFGSEGETCESFGRLEVAYILTLAPG